MTKAARQIIRARRWAYLFLVMAAILAGLAAFNRYGWVQACSVLTASMMAGCALWWLGYTHGLDVMIRASSIVYSESPPGTDE